MSWLQVVFCGTPDHIGCWLFMLGFVLPLLQQAELLRTGDQRLLEQTPLIPVVPATLLLISKKCVNRCFA